MIKKNKGKKGKSGKQLGDYEVGYCKPPKDGKWKPGVSPNPSGRPKRQKTIEEHIYEELDKDITISTPEGKQTIKMRKALAKRYIEKLVKLGDLKHFKDAYRIEKEQRESFEAFIKDEENPVRELHRMLALMLFPHFDELTPEQIDQFLYPDGKFPLDL